MYRSVQLSLNVHFGREDAPQTNSGQVFHIYTMSRKEHINTSRSLTCTVGLIYSMEHIIHYIVQRKTFKLKFLPGIDYQMVLLKANISKFGLFFIESVVMKVLYMTSNKHQYVYHCSCKTKFQQVVHYCKRYHMEADQSQKLQTEYFAKTVRLNVSSVIRFSMVMPTVNSQLQQLLHLICANIISDFPSSAQHCYSHACTYETSLNYLVNYCKHYHTEVGRRYKHLSGIFCQKIHFEFLVSC